MKHNAEYMERMAATVRALKAAWPVNGTPPRGGRGEARDRDKRRARATDETTRRSSARQSSAEAADRVVWQPWTHNLLP